MKFFSATIALLLAVTSVDAFLSQQTSPVAFRSTTPESNLFASKESNTDIVQNLKQFAVLATVSAGLLLGSSPAFADGQTKDFRLPPVDSKDKNRCVLNSSNMGQANAARDKLYDLRECNLAGSKAVGFDLSGVIMTNTDLSKAVLRESYFSKAYLHDSNYDGTDFTNAIIDRASFKGSSLNGAIFTNAVLTGTSFEGANVENADFNEAAIGSFDIKNLCKNPTLKGQNPTTGFDTRESVGCTN